jgi:hypothetical protein
VEVRTMATRSEWFRYLEERSGPKREKQARPKDEGSRAAPKPHNVSERAAKKAVYALEQAGEKRPSRKSSRKAANRQKTDVQFRMKRKTAESRPAGRPNG